MLGVFLLFSWYSSNCDMPFKIIVEFEIIIIDFESIGDFKSHITVGRTLKEPLVFFIYIDMWTLKNNNNKLFNLENELLINLLIY